MRIIDVHTHPVFMGDGADPGATNAWVRRARAAGVSHMVVLGDVLVHGRLPTAAQVAAINDTTHALVLRHRGFFTGFCALNPTLGERTTVAEIERCAALGFRGLKLEISNNARDACMTPVMRAAARLGLVVLQHTWDQTNIRERRFHSDPIDTALLARRFPEVPVIMAHLTGIGWRGVLEARGIDNLFVDTSGGQPEDGLVEFAVEKLGPGRVLYGSDMPIRETSVTIARIRGAAIPDASKRAILGGNTARLLAL
jgi:predicted TIM-barrel fold metal-dependent hydrolase